MQPTLNSQEIFLLNRYISAEYFCELRDTWAILVAHLESCLDRFMQNLPKNYRAKGLPEQPDVVWGHRVIPNFRKTLQGLNSGYILLTHGDLSGLSYSWGPQSDFKGQMDYWSGWMLQADENIYAELLNKAVTLAGNISKTERAGWGPFELSDYGDYLGPLNPPTRWPKYRIEGNVSVATGKKLVQSGIYVPDVEKSCAEFLFVKYETAPAAKVHVGVRPILHPTTGEKYDEEPILEDRDCTWYLVERVFDEQNEVQDSFAPAEQRMRVPAGEPCPETGYYFTPAKMESRSLFQKGEVMPSINSEYGRTVWQWDSDQAS
jgi:hypothetical protein